MPLLVRQIQADDLADDSAGMLQRLHELTGPGQAGGEPAG